MLGFPVDPVTLAEAAAWVATAASGREGGKLVVTLNPEIVVQARADERLAAALRSADLSVADGVGVSWAARRSGGRLPGRVPGVELVVEALRLGGPGLRVFFLGGAPGVAGRAASEAARRFGTTVAGSRDGYFERPRQVPEVCAEVASSGADLLLAGLGAGQERFLFENAAALGAKVMVGVGGTLDVLAGAVKRMPAWTSRLGVEWLFRVLLDPKRWRRAPRLARFVWLVLRRD